MSILECRDLVKVYPNGFRAVDGVSFSVEPGEIVGLLGPNGAGKSTTFRMTCGLTAPTKGTVFLNGQDVSNWPMYKRARHGMGYLPQDQSIFTKLSVERNLIAILEYMPLSSRDRKARVTELLGEFGLEGKRKQVSSTLSGGERRRLEIARCLASNPKIILLDEPFTGIDPTTINDIQDVIGALQDSGISILMTDHRERETLTITDRCNIIVDGRVLVTGDIDDIFRSEDAQSRYFGHRFDPTSIKDERKRFRTDRANSPSVPAPHSKTEKPSLAIASETIAAETVADEAEWL
ncbi:LPS export ABC transporter ATP-binding protein [Thalassoglobus sp.]|uniref:LPS export ABC transporter ATP-binding protein n=1 Tax=Thalassoglobus sp. TaxID=2795869 RepID=UPI003AA86203